MVRGSRDRKIARFMVSVINTLFRAKWLRKASLSSPKWIIYQGILGNLDDCYLQHCILTFDATGQDFGIVSFAEENS